MSDFRETSGHHPMQPIGHGADAARGITGSRETGQLYGNGELALDVMIAIAEMAQGVACRT